MNDATQAYREANRSARAQLAQVTAERDRLHKQLIALTAERNSVCADYISRVSELDKANAEIADYAIERDRILGCVREAMTSAESLRRATGDAIPAAICHCLRAALA